MIQFLTKLTAVDPSQDPQSRYYLYETTNDENQEKWFTVRNAETIVVANLSQRRLSFREVMSEASKAVDDVEKMLRKTEAEVQAEVKKVIEHLKGVTTDVQHAFVREHVVTVVGCYEDEMNGMVDKLKLMVQHAWEKNAWTWPWRWIRLWWYGPEAKLEALKTRIAGLQSRLKLAQEWAQAQAKDDLRILVTQAVASIAARPDNLYVQAGCFLNLTERSTQPKHKQS